jgi:GT2 family glycosyltransferase
MSAPIGIVEPAVRPSISAVVPTVGRSPHLLASLQALRAQRGVSPIEIIVVDQAPTPLELPAGLADRVLRPGRNLGFAGGTNLGLAATGGDFLATVNDDALVAADWAAALAAALLADPRAGAAQGVNLTLAGDLDGCGLGWNRWWQAVQMGHGKPAAALPTDLPPAIEVFGVSATAALYRRTAVESAARRGHAFDPRLESYYEDADLASRLRTAGFHALLVPAARVRHAGSASSGGRRRWRLIYGNRYLAAATLLGRGLLPRLPRLVLRDLADLYHAAARGDAQLCLGIPAGWARAACRLPGFIRFGPPALATAEVARLSRFPPQPR